MSITLDGTNGITASNPATVKANAFLDAAGGNTATVNGTLIPASGVTLVSTAATQTLTNKSIASSQLTGALPAIDGSALTGIVTGGMTLLGTLTTTSGSTVTLSGLTLTSYKSLQFVINGVSGTFGGANYIRLNGINVAQVYITAATDIVSGIGTIDLTTGAFAAAYGRFYASAWQDGVASGGASGLTTASTSITFTISAGTFDAGSIVIYGVK